MEERKIRFYTVECKCGHQQEVKVIRNIYGYQFASKCDSCGRRISQKNTKLIAV